MGKNVLKFPGDVLGYPSTLIRLFIALIILVGAMSIDPQKVSMSSLKEFHMKRIPPRSQWNISQTEYETKHREYFELVEMNQRKRLNLSSNYVYDEENIVRKKLYTFTHSGLKNSPSLQTGKLNLNFKVHIPEVDNKRIEVEETSLRVLIVPRNCATLKQKVFLTISKTHEPHPQHLEEISLDSCLPKWIGIDLFDLYDSNIKSFHKLTIRCKECRQAEIDFLEPHLNVIVNERSRVRRRREKKKRKNGAGKCSRRSWPVDLWKLSGYEFIIQPKSFDAGLCVGKCTNLKHFATQHSHIQYIIAMADGSIPKPCCAPSKMADMEVLYPDEEDSQKLKLTIWNDSKVAECACL